jgi:hypothetical protein
MLLLKELTATRPNVDLLACRVVEVRIMSLCLANNIDFCKLYVRHIYAFSLESRP